MTPPRRDLVPAWMLSADADIAHCGGLYDPTGHVRRTGLFRITWQRGDGDPPPGPGPIDQRPTIDHGSTPEAPARPPLLYLRRPPRRVSLADRFFEWLERRLQWQDDLYP